MQSSGQFLIFTPVSFDSKTKRVVASVEPECNGQVRYTQKGYRLQRVWMLVWTGRERSPCGRH